MQKEGRGSPAPAPGPSPNQRERSGWQSREISANRTRMVRAENKALLALIAESVLLFGNRGHILLDDKRVGDP